MNRKAWTFVFALCLWGLGSLGLLSIVGLLDVERLVVAFVLGLFVVGETVPPPTAWRRWVMLAMILGLGLVGTFAVGHIIAVR